MENKNGALGTRLDLLFLFPVFLICMGVLVSDYKPISNFVGSVTTIITLIFLRTHSRYSLSKFERRNCCYVFFFLIYFVFTSLFNFEPYACFTSIMVYIMVFTPFFLWLYLEHTNNVKFMRYAVFCFVITWNVFLVLCFVSCLSIPDLARLMAADRPSYVYVLNGGGYPMGYGSAILGTFLYSRLLKRGFNGLLVKLFVTAEIVFMIMTILVINSFVILCSLLAGFIISTINSFTRKGQSRWITYLFTGIVLFVLYLSSGTVLKYLANNVKSDFWNRRFTEVYEAVASDKTSAHIDSREEVYHLSIDGILKSPIVGNGYKFGNVFQKEGSNGVGNHSTFLDTLAQFGIIGGLPVFLFLLYPLYRARKRNEDAVYLVPFYVMACLNPTLRFYHVMLIVYLIIPAMQYLSANKYKL